MSSHDANNLSDEQIDCAFDYFLLCDRKLLQMEESVDDPGALRHLLNDKQSDLELAAQIGKSLLDRNRDLDQQLRDSDRQIAAAMETIKQLQHTLDMKEELLQMWNNQNTEEGPLSDDTHHVDSKVALTRRRGEIFAKANAQASQDDIEFIHRKLQVLEDESVVTQNMRAEEQATIMRECLRKLGDAVIYMKSLSDEQFRRSDALVHQQNQVNALAARSRELENSLNQVGLTNEMLASKVEELNAVNQKLVHELRDMKDRYDESLTLYTQAQANVRKLRDRSRRASLHPTCLLYSPLSGGGGKGGDDGGRGVTSTPNVHFSPSIDKPLSVADELALSSAFEKSLQPGVTSRPSERCSPQVVIGKMQGRPGRALVETGIENECAEWDDPTIDSSGFASCSEPVDLTHRSWRGCINGAASSSATAVLDGRDFFDWDAGDDDDDGDDVGRKGETETEDGESSSEIFGAFAQRQHFCQPIHLTDHPGDLHHVKALRQRPKSLNIQALLSTSPAPHEPFVDRRSLAIDQKAVTPPALHTFDYCALDSTKPTSVAPRAVRSPQRLQLVKQLRGSGVLQRWQRLATPSLTAALYEMPLNGVASRGIVFSSDHPPTIPMSCLPPLRWASGSDLSRTHPSLSFSSCSSADNRFVPILSHSLFQYSGAVACSTSTDKLLSEFLATSQRTRPIATLAARAQPTAVVPEARCMSPSFQPCGRQSPTRGITTLRSVSPVCQGLLDASEMASDLPDFSATIIRVPPPRSASPQASASLPSTFSTRRHNISRASPTLHSVKEEASFRPPT